MTKSTALTPSTVEQNNMEPHWEWYLTGSFDTIGIISVRFSEAEQMNVGYEMYPEIRYSRPEVYSSAIGMFDEYLEEHNIHASIREANNAESVKLTIGRREDVKKFLELVYEGLVQKKQAAEIMLDEVIPNLKPAPSNKKEMLDLMDSIDRLREHTSSGGRVKYTKEFFEKEL
jgi:hypothetical protein